MGTNRISFSGPVQEESFYTVQAGDNLTKIAKATGFSLKSMKEANPGINYDRLSVNQKLRLPSKGMTLPLTKEKPFAGDELIKTTVAKKPTIKEEKNPFSEKIFTEPHKIPEKFYIVQPGDNLVTIEKKLFLKNGQLREANNINDPKKLRPGQKLIIPDKKLKILKVDENDKTFRTILAKILETEGGLTADRKTNKGIKQETYERYLKDKDFDKCLRRERTFKGDEILNITDEEVKEIYYNYYYLGSGADKVKNKKTAYFITDSAVQHGVGTAKRLKEFCGDNYNLWYMERNKIYDSYIKENPLKFRHKEGWLARLKKLVNTNFT